MVRRNFYSNVPHYPKLMFAVSFKQIQNMTEIAKMNQDTKGYSLGVLIDFCRYFKPSANS